jgi:ABC-type sugar transport system permease subunit
MQVRVAWIKGHLLLNNKEGITVKIFNSRMTKKSRDALTFYALVFPFIIMLFFLKLFPILKGVWLSFTNFTGFNYGSEKFIGAFNYKRILTDHDAIYSFFRTLEIGLIMVPLNLAIGLVLALLLNKAIKGVSLFRVLFYLPSIIPVVASGMMWRGIFQKNDGLINNLLGIIGIRPLHWLGYDLVTVSLIIMMLWTAGSGLLINLAALKGVPIELYESSQLDGASAFQQFIRITFPMISPTIFFNLLIGIINTLQLFTQPVMLTEGDNWSLAILNTPLKPNYTYLVHIYQQIFVGSRYGYGLALVWIIFIVIMLMTLVVYSTSKYWVHYEVDQDNRRRSG